MSLISDLALFAIPARINAKAVIPIKADLKKQVIELVLSYKIVESSDSSQDPNRLSLFHPMH